jgi:hypothetical protein
MGFNGIQKGFMLMEDTQCLERTNLKCKVLWTVLDSAIESGTSNIRIEHFNDELLRKIPSHCQPPVVRVHSSNCEMQYPELKTFEIDEKFL